MCIRDRTEIALPEELQRQTETLWQRGETQRAEELAQLWNVLCGVLDQFVEMLGGTELDAEEFARLMRLVLTQYSVGTIPVSLDRVSLAEMTRNDRHAVRVLFQMCIRDRSILVWWLYYRCPQCHESLGRGNPKHCPHCGAGLGDEPEPEEKKKIQHKKKRR